MERTEAMTHDEVRLLLVLAAREVSGPESLGCVLKGLKGYYNLEAKLSSLLGPPHLLSVTGLPRSV